jgi:hypothetical protein
MSALLGETGVIDDDHPVRSGKDLRHTGAVLPQHRCGVPRALTDELVEPLDITTRNPLAEGLGGLALAVEQQSMEIDASLTKLVAPWKQPTEAPGIVLQAFENVRVEFRGE